MKERPHAAPRAPGEEHGEHDEAALPAMAPHPVGEATGVGHAQLASHPSGEAIDVDAGTQRGVAG
eukprot:1293355-Alexandrium_andersonii.AAC.1